MLRTTIYIYWLSWEDYSSNGLIVIVDDYRIVINGRLMKQPSYVGFKSKEYHWKSDIDYSENPHLYKVGRGQQGVLICQLQIRTSYIHVEI